MIHWSNDVTLLDQTINLARINDLQNTILEQDTLRPNFLQPQESPRSFVGIKLTISIELEHYIVRRFSINSASYLRKNCPARKQKLIMLRLFFSSFVPKVRKSSSTYKLPRKPKQLPSVSTIRFRGINLTSDHRKVPSLYVIRSPFL